MYMYIYIKAVTHYRNCVYQLTESVKKEKEIK